MLSAEGNWAQTISGVGTGISWKPGSAPSSSLKQQIVAKRYQDVICEGTVTEGVLTKREFYFSSGALSWGNFNQDD